MQALASSYKDPSGYIFQHEQEVYRAVNKIYLPQYEKLMNSGLYTELTKEGLLISHQEEPKLPKAADVEKILKPVQIPLISYAYEWSFSMLQDAALCTLQNALKGISFGMILKDANTFNIQFYQGKPILIDTLSFDFYHEEESWVAYRQFCECFVAPLVLMKYCNPSLNKLLIAYPNGIPLTVCKSMLPLKAKWNLHVYLHVFLQSKVQQSSNSAPARKQVFTKQKMLTLLNGLYSFVKNLKPAADKTTWDNYYEETILSKEYLQEKKALVSKYLKQIPFGTLLDLGANEGEFSLLFKNTDKQIISVDEDRHCIEKLYLTCKTNKISNVQPLILDLTAPSAAIGWNNAERDTFFKRIKPDVTLALALIHHLCIAHNISIPQIISLLHSISEFVIIEFVDKSDPKVMHLLANRIDIFEHYHLDGFRQVALQKFDIIAEQSFSTASRTLFLLKRKAD